jgi:hypothetical protein
MAIVKIGNGSGFWGDNGDGPIQLVQQTHDLDYLTLDYLAEVSLSIMAAQREKDPQTGYAKDFVSLIERLIPFWQNGSKVKVIANAGGLNPAQCAKACAEVLRKHKLRKKIGIVAGDDILEQFRTLVQEPLQPKLVTANAYLGAQPIVELLKQDAEIVITGRVADPSLTVAPVAAHFGWNLNDYPKIAAATIAGHLIECGTQVTGGISNLWPNIPNLANIGFPIIEMEQDGTFTVTKPNGTGGVVNEWTVKEQLVYEIGDPDNYLSPDVTASFLGLKLEQTGSDRIKVTGAIGKPPTDSYKVSSTYRDGYKTEGTLVIFGRDAFQKAKACGDIIMTRLQQSNMLPEEFTYEGIGTGSVVPGVLDNDQYPDSLECVLRIAAWDPEMPKLERLAREIAPLVTSGPPGVTGYTTGRPHIRPVFNYLPGLIPKVQVKATVEMMETT